VLELEDLEDRPLDVDVVAVLELVGRDYGKSFLCRPNEDHRRHLATEVYFARPRGPVPIGAPQAVGASRPRQVLGKRDQRTPSREQLGEPVEFREHRRIRQIRKAGGKQRVRNVLSALGMESMNRRATHGLPMTLVSSRP